MDLEKKIKERARDSTCHGRQWTENSGPSESKELWWGEILHGVEFCDYFLLYHLHIWELWVAADPSFSLNKQFWTKFLWWIGGEWWTTSSWAVAAWLAWHGGGWQRSGTQVRLLHSHTPPQSVPLFSLPDITREHLLGAWLLSSGLSLGGIGERTLPRIVHARTIFVCYCLLLLIGMLQKSLSLRA